MVLLAVLPVRSEPLRVEFGVLLCEDVSLQVSVLGFGRLELLLESRLVSGYLLLCEGKDSGSCLAELVVRGNLRRFVGFLGQVTRVADTTGVERALFLGEIGVAVAADLTVVVIDHDDRLVLSHSVFGVDRPCMVDANRPCGARFNISVRHAQHTLIGGFGCASKHRLSTERRCKGTMKKLPFANFFAKKNQRKCKIMGTRQQSCRAQDPRGRRGGGYRSEIHSSQIHRFTDSRICVC